MSRQKSRNMMPRPAVEPANPPWAEWGDETLMAQVRPGETPTPEQRVANAVRILKALDARIGRDWSKLPDDLVDIGYDIQCAIRSLTWTPAPASVVQHFIRLGVGRCAVCRGPASDPDAALCEACRNAPSPGPAYDQEA